MNKTLKYIIGVFLAFSGLLTIFAGSFIGGLFIGIAGVALLPPISEKIKERIKFWNNPVARRGFLIALVIVGFGVMGNNADKNNFEVSSDKVVDYIQTSKDDKSINNIKKLAEAGELFNESNYAFERTKKHLEFKMDSLTNRMSFEFNPKFYFKEKAEYITFLKEHLEKGRLDDYRLRFDVDSLGNILTKSTIIIYSKGGAEKFKNSDVPNFDAFIDEKKVAIQEKKVEKQNQIKAAEEEKKKGMEAYNKRAKKFEDDCLNPWNGSHILFSRMIKEQLNDPSSFDHVTTTYRLFKGYAVINMTYRGKNAFNATITKKLSAKVSTEDCSVIEIFE